MSRIPTAPGHSVVASVEVERREVVFEKTLDECEVVASDYFIWVETLEL